VGQLDDNGNHDQNRCDIVQKGGDKGSDEAKENQDPQRLSAGELGNAERDYGEEACLLAAMLSSY